MSSSVQHHLLVVVMGPTDQRLSEKVTQRDWPVICCDDLAGAIRQVIVMQPAVLLVQVDEGRGLQRVVDVLMALRNARPDARLYVWAPVQSDDLERAARSVGIHVYTAGKAGLEAVEHAVSQAQGRDSPVRIHSPPPSNRSTGQPP